MPVAGRTVFDPITDKLLTDDGLEVTESIFWIRRRTQGDVKYVAKPNQASDQHFVGRVARDSQDVAFQVEEQSGLGNEANKKEPGETRKKARKADG